MPEHLASDLLQINNVIGQYPRLNRLIIFPHSTGHVRQQHVYFSCCFGRRCKRWRISHLKVPEVILQRLRSAEIPLCLGPRLVAQGLALRIPLLSPLSPHRPSSLWPKAENVVSLCVCVCLFTSDNEILSPPWECESGKMCAVLPPYSVIHWFCTLHLTAEELLCQRVSGCVCVCVYSVIGLDVNGSSSV